jgi:acetyl esterase/lipase
MVATPRPGKRLLAAFLMSAAITAAGLQAAVAEPLSEKLPVRRYADITYYDVANDPDADRHKLDVYRPKGKGPYPVLFFIHGGAWVMSSKDDVFGLFGYGSIARCMAERGLVVIVPNYRLSPKVRHPGHIKDVARAFRWAFEHCKEYDGDPQQLFVGGHSAGGHLAALLAMDETYLKEVGRAANEIRGVIGISGVYRVDAFDLQLSWLSEVMQVNLALRPSSVVFGDDPEVVRKASPLNHVRPGLPPFLVITGGCDDPPLQRMAKDLTAALRKNKCEFDEQEIPWRTHETLLFDIPRFEADRVTLDTMMQFIDRHGPKSTLKKGQ